MTYAIRCAQCGGVQLIQAGQFHYGDADFCTRCASFMREAVQSEAVEYGSEGKLPVTAESE